MNEFVIPCACGMRGCSTYLTIKTDDDKPENLLFSIKDDRHELETWISLDKESAYNLVSAVQKKFGRLERGKHAKENV